MHGSIRAKSVQSIDTNNQFELTSFKYATLVILSGEV